MMFVFVTVSEVVFSIDCVYVSLHDVCICDSQRGCVFNRLCLCKFV